jgi:hypothetical protein
VQKVCFHGSFDDESGNYSDVTHCHIIGKLFLLRSIFLTMLLELRSVFVLSYLILFCFVLSCLLWLNLDQNTIRFLFSLSGQNWIRFAPIKNRYRDTADCHFHRFIWSHSQYLKI